MYNIIYCVTSSYVIDLLTLLNCISGQNPDQKIELPTSPLMIQLQNYQ